jgi:CheY-like chemotaxis protein
MKVPLAEDNPMDQKVASMVLRCMGHKVDVAANGVEVLEALEYSRYDVILLDIRMPQMMA